MRTNALGVSGPHLAQVHLAKGWISRGRIKLEQRANHLGGIETDLFHLIEVVCAKEGRVNARRTESIQQSHGFCVSVILPISW